MAELANPHEEEALGKAYDARLMRRLIGYLRPYRGMTLGALALILLAAALQLVGPLALAVALDLFVHPQAPGTAAPTSPTPATPPDTAVLSPVSVWLQNFLHARGIEAATLGARGLAAVSLVYIAVIVLTFFNLYAQGHLLQMMGQRIMNDLRRQIFGHLQRLPISFFDRNPIGRLVTRVTTDVDALNEMFTAGLVSIFGDLALLVGIVVVLFWMDWRLALVAFSIVPLLLGLTFWFKARVRDAFRDVRVKVAHINSFLQEHFSGMAVVQLFGREAPAYREFQEINDYHREANVRSIFYYAVFYPGVELITVLGTGLLLWYGGGEVVQKTISVGALVAFIQFAQRFYQPLSDLSEKYNVLQGAMASSERIFQLIDTPVTLASPPQPYRPEGREGVEGAVEFDRVQFSYQPGEPVLRGISFRVEPGETLAVVGHTGAGKSTLANLLLRFYDVDAGEVRVDGVDVRHWDLPSLRRSIALVLQDVFLFSGSIGDNILLGRRGQESNAEPHVENVEMNAERLRWAAGEVHALPFIERLPEGFETKVRERGAGLSVGQKQLIAFARALAFDPRILILDEATSSIDTETEQLIQKALDRLMLGRTSIVIAHRLSTIQKADRILVLHKGEVREIGTHQELIALKGIYYRLYLLQYQEQETGEIVASQNAF
jgi:ATP-binding cassette subfamily B multidrug efflux pump